MLPLSWPDINWLISFENETLFTSRKLPRGNYCILKINLEEVRYQHSGGTDLRFTASPSYESWEQFFRKIQPQQNSLANSEAEASQTPPPHSETSSTLTERGGSWLNPMGKVKDENIINPPPLSTHRWEISTNFIFDAFPNYRLSFWLAWIRKLPSFNTTLSSFDFEHSKR